MLFAPHNLHRLLQRLERSQAVAFLEGKVTIERTATAEGSTKAFTFKCHRRGNAVFPVNAVAFSPRCRSLVFTGGSDGLVCAWDFEKRKKIFQFAKFASSVSALDVSEEGGAIAVASSYTWDQGEVAGVGPNELWVRELAEPEFAGG